MINIKGILVQSQCGEKIVGYVYLTENLVNNRIYIGKHISAEYDSSYLGSGSILRQAIKKYGKENFSNIILYEADTIEELNKAEIYYIGLYREKFGRKLYNIANGGDGGDTLKYATEAEKEAFKKKMSKINKERCSTQDFKAMISKITSARFSDPAEREKQSKRVRDAWKNKELIESQRAKLLDYYSNHTKDNSYCCKKCALELDGKTYNFGSRKELDSFLKTKFNLSIDRKLETHLLLTGEEYKPFHKNKLKKFIGMRMYYKQQNENVETIGDECNRVGHEIGTCPKCKTEIEDIVHSA